MVIEVLFLWCVQEVAELKEEEIISHTAATEPLAVASVGGHDPTHPLSESQNMIEYKCVVMKSEIILWKLFSLL